MVDQPKTPGDTTANSVIWVPGEETARNSLGEFVEAPATPEVKEKDAPKKVEVTHEPSDSKKQRGDN